MKRLRACSLGFMPSKMAEWTWVGVRGYSARCVLQSENDAQEAQQRR